MPVVLARVDNRLVHGQVLEGWVPRLGVQTILVVDAAIACDAFQRAVLEGLGLGGIDIRLCTPQEAASLLTAELSAVRTLVLFAGVCQAVAGWRSGVRFERLNLGNLHPREGGCEVTPSVFLTPPDLLGLRELLAEGIALEARAVPGERSPDLAAWVRECSTREGKA